MDIVVWVGHQFSVHIRSGYFGLLFHKYQLLNYHATQTHIHMNMPSTCIWSDFVQVDHFSTYGSSTGLHIPQEKILDH